MKIGLINPPYRYKADPSNEDLFHLPGIAYVSASLKRTIWGNHDVVNVDFQHDPNASIRQVKDCDLVGLGSHVACYEWFRKVLPHLKQQNPGRAIVVGGPLISSYSRSDKNNLLMREFREIDFGVIGEGEHIMTDLAFHLESSSGARYPFGTVVNSTTGVIDVYSHDKLVQRVEKLDTLPELDYQRDWPGFAQAVKGHVFNVQFSRGCSKPTPCSFCYRLSKGVRSFSLSRIEREVSRIAALKPRSVFVGDDTFTYDSERAVAIGQILKRAGFTYGIEARVDGIDEALAKKLAETGCRHVAFGVESFDQNLLDGSGKGVRVEQIYEAARVTRAAGMDARAFILLGLPGENFDTLARTFEGIRETGMLPRARLLIPLPGTRIYNEHVRGDYFSEIRLLEDMSRYPDTSAGNWVPINLSDGLRDEDLVTARDQLNEIRAEMDEKKS